MVLTGLVILVLIGVSVATRATAAQDDLDVLKVIPENYKLVLDNAFVRVIEGASRRERPSGPIAICEG